VKLCGSELPPLKGVFHLAGVMDGGSILAQNATLYPDIFIVKLNINYLDK
jgi:hypothetical protein